MVKILSNQTGPPQSWRHGKPCSGSGTQISAGPPVWVVYTSVADGPQMPRFVHRIKLTPPRCDGRGQKGILSPAHPVRLHPHQSPPHRRRAWERSGHPAPPSGGRRRPRRQPLPGPGRLRIHWYHNPLGMALPKLPHAPGRRFSGRLGGPRRSAVHTSMGVPARCISCPMLHPPTGCAGLTG